jgi:hypothetical protein
MGFALLCLLAKSLGCGGDPYETIAEVEQGWGGTGTNGITPEILAANFLDPIVTNAAGVTPSGADPVKLCDWVGFNSSTNQVECKLEIHWHKWLFSSGPASDPGTQARHELLKGLVDCALPSDHTVLVPGFPNEDGMFGLYKDWTSTPLPIQYRQVLSACVLAKLNAFGATVGIGIIGPEPALASGLSDPIADPSFVYQEAAFWGDLFDSKPRLMACSGKKSAGGSYPVGKNLRICGEMNNKCGLIALGPCEGLSVSYCDSWAGSNGIPGVGGGEYCFSTNDGTGAHYKYPITVYLDTEPELVDGDPFRCGWSGKESCEEDVSSPL